MQDKKNHAGRSGRRREISPTQAIRFPNRWLPSMEGRRSQFREWRYIAMQVLQRQNGPFRLVAIIGQVFDFDAGECWATDDEFAIEAGHCAGKTISREIAALRNLGLISVDPGWVEKSGKMRKGRRIRLAIPADLSGINLR